MMPKSKFSKITAQIAGKQKPKHEFAASDLVIATRAFIESNPQLKKPDEAEGLLEREEGYTDMSSFDVGDINDVVSTLKKIGVDIHQKIMERYPDNHADGSTCGRRCGR